ncbi:chemotaxis protein CheB [Burkholderia ubonensis]|uniref:chemotaxis protein CheB n=2 Tax=Burkholderia ubonensis TaxID=101571 RepID=UPI001E56B292|nr:chemotaxis protein CheB [Burkholderia ubonensis]
METDTSTRNLIRRAGRIPPGSDVHIPAADFATCRRAKAAARRMARMPRARVLLHVNDSRIGARMTHRDFIAIGASSGGVDALRILASLLPGDLPATIAIVVHIGVHDSCLPSLLCDSGPLRAEHAKDGQTYRIGSIYVAPPDRHLIVEGAHFRLLNGAKENFARPAIDPLFRSAAAEMGARVIGVILTGTLDDGAAGLEAIQSCGGSTIVQDPAEAFAGEMPLHAARYADQVLSLDGLAHRLIELTTGGGAGGD